MPSTPEFVRPATAPDFLLSRAHGSVRTQGSSATFTSTSQASQALHRGEHELIVGALPFDPREPAALTVPKTVWMEDGPLEPPAYYRGKGSAAKVIRSFPSVDDHAAVIDGIVRTIAATGLDKVVIARYVDILFDQPIDPLLLAARLIERAENLDGFLADLSPAGTEWEGKVLVGSSPEMLIRRKGNEVSAYPLAGSIPRVSNKVEDEERGANLLESSKDLEEHAFVIEHYRDVLTDMCSSVDIPDTPELTCTREMWHLATPIHATISSDSSPTTTTSPSALDLAVALHPTPAICGVPTQSALELITSVEQDRGFYAGAVGWCNSDGDGEFMVSIRCAQLAADRVHARAWAGGGIVEQSDPWAEVDETRGKLRTALRAMGAKE